MRPADRGLHHPQSFQPDRFGADIFEQPKTAAEEHRHDVDVQLIDESRFQALLRGTRTPDDGNILVACGRSRSSNRAGYPAGHITLAILLSLETGCQTG